MKKGILAAVGLIAVLTVLLWPNRKVPAAGNSATPVGGSAGAPGGDALSAVAIKDLNDHDVTLAQYKRQVVLVNFWATWCEPCQVEIPWMIALQKKYGPRGFTILGLSMDQEGKKVVEPFFEQKRFDVDGQKEAMNYPILLGNDSIGSKFGGILGLPTSMLFTRDGQKIKTITGLIDRDDLSKAIEGQL